MHFWLIGLIHISLPQAQPSKRVVLRAALEKGEGEGVDIEQITKDLQDRVGQAVLCPQQRNLPPTLILNSCTVPAVGQS